MSGFYCKSNKYVFFEVFSDILERPAEWNEESRGKILFKQLAVEGAKGGWSQAVEHLFE